MANFWRSLPNGTRALALLSVVGFLAILILNAATGVDLRAWIGLDGAALSGFQVWRLITYALIPGDPVSAFFGTLFLLVLGPSIERQWSPAFFLSYFLTCAAVSGLVMLWFLGIYAAGLLTTAGALMGLIVAWYQINRFQRFLLFGGPEVSAATAAIVTALFIVVPVALGCGWILTPGIAAGAPTGWIFLRLCSLRSDRRIHRGAQGTRTRRLEL